MIGRRIFRFLKMAVIVTAAVLLFGFVVTHLWNYVMPSLFGLHLITFRQASRPTVTQRVGPTPSVADPAGWS